MKKLMYLFLALSILCACKKDGKNQGAPETPVSNDTLAVNYYKPAATTQTDVPQFTIKNNNVQFTAIGSNENGQYNHISKIFISDAESNTEWVTLINSINQPEFIYTVNSSTKEKLPELYWIEHTADNKVILRYYKYDWINRLGTLVYEAEVDGNNEVKILFDNSVNSSIASLSSLRTTQSSGSAARSGQKTAATPRSFPSPVLAFNKFSSTSNEIFENEDINDFLKELKDLKEQGIKASCTVSSVLGTPDRSFVCKLADILDKHVNEKLFDEVIKIDEQQKASDFFKFEGENINYLVQRFNDFEVLDNLGERHFNNLRDNLPTLQTFRDWFSNVLETSNTMIDDLDDLSDSNGVLQIGLSWTTSNTDIDLHVTDPNGEEIYYNHPNSISGGYLDRDDTDGFGPENIYWTKDIPDGTYSISVVYFGPADGPFTDFTVKVINGLGVSKNITGGISFSGQNSGPITSFTKRGNQITFN